MRTLHVIDPNLSAVRRRVWHLKGKRVIHPHGFYRISSRLFWKLHCLLSLQSCNSGGLSPLPQKKNKYYPIASRLAIRHRL